MFIHGKSRNLRGYGGKPPSQREGAQQSRRSRLEDVAGGADPPAYTKLGPVLMISTLRILCVDIDGLNARM